MAVERLIQKIKLGERQLMQESMCKLITMISENKKTQEEIVKALPESDIITMMTYLEDPDPYFRKLTAKFFLDLLYGNYTVQQIFCDILGILPCDGKVCINKIPDSFKRSNRSIAEYLEIMKKGCPEEIKETLPYCWYFNPENMNNAGKQVEFILESQKNSLEDLDKFVDPMSVMFGFIVRVPKVKKAADKAAEYVEKTVVKEYEARRVATAANRKALHAINSSLDQSLQGRLLNDSKSVERETPKNISPVRGLTAGGITSSRANNSRNSKLKVEPLTSPSICNSERANQSKFALTSERGGEASKNIDKEIHKIFGTKRYSIESDKIKNLNTMEVKDKKTVNIRPDYSIDTTDVMQTSKVTASNNESQDLGLKLESSGIISTVNKTSVPSKLNDKNLDVSLYKVINDRKTDLLKKNVGKYDKAKPNMRMSKNIRDTNSHSFSMTTTPKNTLLSKILKDKPVVKEVISASKQAAKQKQDVSKRLNTTNTVTVSSPTKHITHKLSIGLHQLKAPSKSELEYANKKHAFHSSLLKSIDMTDQTSTTILIEEKEESAVKENLEQDSNERRQSLKDNAKSKISQLASVLKGSATTPRTPTEILKSTMNQNSKILNNRRSQDTSSYLSSLARDKRKSEASIPFQNIKNRYSDLKDSSLVRNSLTEFTLDFTQSTTPKTFIK